MRTKNDFYRESLPLLNGGRVELLDNSRLVNQLCALERRTARGGRDTIDHPPGSHDDVANAAAIALVLAAAEAEPALIRSTDLGADEGEEVPPHLVAATLAVVSISDLGQVGVAYVAVPPLHLADQPIYILDLALAPLSATVFASIALRLDQLAEDIREAAGGRRPVHVALYVPQAFHPSALNAMRAVDWHAERREVRNVVAEPIEPNIDSAFLADRDRLHFAAAAHISAGRVRFSPLAMVRSRELPVMSALTSWLGERDDESPIAAAVWLATILQFEPQPSRRAA